MANLSTSIWERSSALGLFGDAEGQCGQQPVPRSPSLENEPWSCCRHPPLFTDRLLQGMHTWQRKKTPEQSRGMSDSFILRPWLMCTFLRKPVSASGGRRTNRCPCLLCAALGMIAKLPGLVLLYTCRSPFGFPCVWQGRCSPLVVTMARAARSWSPGDIPVAAGG